MGEEFQKPNPNSTAARESSNEKLQEVMEQKYRKRIKKLGKSNKRGKKAKKKFRRLKSKLKNTKALHAAQLEACKANARAEVYAEIAVRLLQAIITEKSLPGLQESMIEGKYTLPDD